MNIDEFKNSMINNDMIKSYLINNYISKSNNNKDDNNIDNNNENDDNNDDTSDLNNINNDTNDYVKSSDINYNNDYNDDDTSDLDNINNNTTNYVKSSDINNDDTSDYEEFNIKKKNSQIFIKDENDENEKKIRDEILKIYNIDFLPIDHIKFLEKLSTDMNFKPKVAYDIGSAVFHWTRHSKRIWPDSKIICFEANPDLEFLYKQHDHEYFIGLLSDSDNLKYKYYYNRIMFGGNSMYFENGNYFSEDTYLLLDTYKLDTIVERNNYPYPDLIKMDTQGSELNIIKGATKVLEHCKYLILELQDIDYNKNSPKSHDVIEYLKTIGYICIAHKFSNNNADYDSCFINTKFISQLNC